MANLEHSKRLEKLYSLNLLDTLTDEAFDRLTRLASRVLDTPISLVSLVDADRQFFKSFVGLPEPWATKRETPLSHSFCQHVVATGQPLVISDARTHPLVQNNLAIRDLDVIAYAGMPLITSDGYGLGSFCVICPEPREWTEEELSILSDLAASVMTEIELQSELQDRKDDQANLAKSEERYRILSELMSDYAFSTQLGSTGKPVTDWITEEAFERVTGYTLTEVLSLPSGTIMLEEYAEKAREDAQAALAGETRQGQYMIKTKHGDLRWLLVKRYPRWNEAHDQVIGFYGIAQDITEEQLMQQKKQELIAEEERARALQQFISDVSHDFRTPLSIIQTSLYLLKQTIDSNKHERLNIISEQATRIDDLIENLILMSRLNNSGESNFTSVDVNQIVKDLQIEFTQTGNEGIEIAWQLAEKLSPIYADRTHLSLAITHLIDNAIQFTPSSQEIFVRSYQEADAIIFEVEDTGIGIASADLPHIFERFFRADSARSLAGGHGMGLAIVQLIVDIHNGSVEVESKIDQGSLFRIRLPILISNSA